MASCRSPWYAADPGGGRAGLSGAWGLVSSGPW
jgi:hypothetical protein